MNILMSPADYAMHLIDFAINDYERSMHTLYDAIRAHPQMPNSYVFAVMRAIDDAFAPK